MQNYLLYLPLCIGPALMLYTFFLIGLKHDKIMGSLSDATAYLLLITYIIINLLAIFILDGRDIKLYNYGLPPEVIISNMPNTKE